MCLRGRHGQIATFMLLLIACLMLLSMVTFNVGMVGLMKTETSNAADAAALAAASWVASAQNEVAMGPAKEMWVNYLAFQALIAWPPFHRLRDLISVYVIYTVLQEWRRQTAVELLHSGWEQAHAAAFMTALNNLDIDDTRPATEAGSFGHFYHTEIEERFRAIQDDEDDALDFPAEIRFRWDRQPTDTDATGAPRGEQEVAVGVTFHAPPPEFDTASVAPPLLGWFWVRGPWFAVAPHWGWGYRKIAINLPWVLPTVPMYVLWPRVEDKWFPLPVPWPAIRPNEIRNGDGRITVTVTRTSQEADLRLWQMQYQGGGHANITSRAVGAYGAADVGLWPRDRSLPFLDETDGGNF